MAKEFPHRLNDRNVCEKCKVEIVMIDSIYVHKFPPELHSRIVFAPQHLPCSGFPSSFHRSAVYPLFYHKWHNIMVEGEPLKMCARCGVQSREQEKDGYRRYFYKFLGTSFWLKGPSDGKFAIPCSLVPSLPPANLLTDSHKWLPDQLVDVGDGNMVKADVCARCGTQRYGSHQYYWSCENQSSTDLGNCARRVHTVAIAWLDSNLHTTPSPAEGQIHDNVE